MRVNVPIGKVCARAFTIPTDKPEADGTIAWRSTTLVVVEINGGDRIGLGNTCSGASLAQLIEPNLAETIAGLGAPIPKDGANRPDLSRPGNGLILKRQDAASDAA